MQCGTFLGLGDRVARSDSPGEMGDNLPVTHLGSGKTAVKCWGGAIFGIGALGYGDTLTRGLEQQRVR